MKLKIDACRRLKLHNFACCSQCADINDLFTPLKGHKRDAYNRIANVSNSLHGPFNGKAVILIEHRTLPRYPATPRRRAGWRGWSGGVYTCMPDHTDSLIFHWYFFVGEERRG